MSVYSFCVKMSVYSLRGCMCKHCVSMHLSPPPHPPPIPIHTTNSFWLSTILLVVVSVCSFYDFSECVAFGKVRSKLSGLKIIKYYDVFGWLNWLDAELSPKGYWCGLRSQEVGEGRGRRLYLMLLCHNQNDSCIKMGSDESHLNVSSIVKDKVTRQCTPTVTYCEDDDDELMLNVLRCHETY